MKILVTGAAGFIGFHLSQRLLARGDTVVGIDNLNDYYDVSLKEARLRQFNNTQLFQFKQLDLTDRSGIEALFQQHQFEVVVNLAAQAGVRYSLQNPYTYIESNVMGFMNVLEACRANQVGHLVYASTSSVYGANSQQPFSESDHTNHPLAIYAASKKSNELMAHAYSSLYQLPTTGLRFFTVYGPWGRPDMALFKFTKAILADEPIDVYNHGKMVRDFTYVGDIVSGILRAIDHPAQPDANWDGDHPNPATSYAPYRIYNIGNSQPVSLMEYIHALEKALGKEAKMHMLPMQPGDVSATYADTTRLQNDLSYRPETSVEKGIQAFVDWYVDYYQ